MARLGRHGGLLRNEMNLYRIGIRTRRSIALAILVVLGMSIPDRGAAQPYNWRMMVRLPTPITCGYFWNATLGVVASDTQIYITQNGAVWQATASFPTGSWVNAIRCFDKKTLYAAVMSGGVSKGTYRNVVAASIWFSSDSGMTWKIYSQGSGQFGADVYWNYKTNTPTLKGSTVARIDALHLAASLDDQPMGPQYSSDGGNSWRLGTPLGIYSEIYQGYGMYADTINRVYYVSSEITYRPFFHSTDLGLTWTAMSNLPGGATWGDDIEGAGSRVYVPSSNGLFMTTDQGATWTNIGSVYDVADDGHFCVFGCNGLSVVTYDATGGVYIMGDDDAAGTSVDSPIAFTSNLCDSTSIQFQPGLSWRNTKFKLLILQDSAGSFSIAANDTLSLQGVGSPVAIQYKPHSTTLERAILRVTPVGAESCGGISYPLTGQAHWGQAAVKTHLAQAGCVGSTFSIGIDNQTCLNLHIASVQVLNDSFGRITALPFDSLRPSKSSDSVTFLYAPPNWQEVLKYSVRFRGTYEPYGLPFDTTVQVSVQTSHITSALVSNTEELQFGSIPECGDADTVFHFQNYGCDTLRVLLHQQGLESCWTVTPNEDTLTLVPGQSDSVRIHFSGGMPRSYHQFLSYKYVGPRSDVLQVVLDGVVLPASPLVAVPSRTFDLGNRSVCANDTTLEVTLSNIGCDSVLISNALLNSGSSFLLVNPGDTILPPNGILRETITYHPMQRGIQSQALTLRISRTDGTLAHDTTLHFAVNVVHGASYLQTSVSAVDLGAIYACQLRDTVLLLRNTGCDTLTVSSGAFSNIAYVADRIYPILLPPDSSVPVHVFLTPDTTGHPMTISGTFTFISDADTGSTISIPLTVSMIYPQHLSLSLSPQDSAGAGQSVTFKLILSGSAPGVSALHFDLTNDDNLLSFVSARGNGLVWAQGAVPTTRHFTLSPVPPAGEIGTVEFKTFLSTTSATPITLSQPTFENDRNVPNDCIASVGDSSSSFTYDYTCSDGLMQELMTSGTFIVTGIRPNPASGEAVISYSLAGTLPVAGDLSIEDPLGREVLRIAVILQPGANQAQRFSLAGLPSGVYLLRAGDGKRHSTWQVVKER